MGCRVGMSTTPEERIDYWKRREGHTHGKTLVRRLTYEKAQELEAEEAEKHGCFHKEGGEYQSGPVWSVYRVWGGTVP